MTSLLVEIRGAARLRPAGGTRSALRSSLVLLVGTVFPPQLFTKREHVIASLAGAPGKRVATQAHELF